PLFSHPGRGLAHQKFWTYSSKVWFMQSDPPCDPTIAQCPPPNPPFWTYANSSQPFSQIQESTSTGCHDGHMHSELTNYTYVDPEGTAHTFDAVTSVQIPPPNCIHVKTIGYSLDNSGMRFDASTGIVTFKDGSSAQRDPNSGQGAALLKDANGNSIGAASAPGTGEIDTLGRNVQH